MSRPDAASGSAAPPKQLSSRLMTMKTPGSERPLKRRRVETTNSAASTPGVLSDAEQGPAGTAARGVISSRHGEETEWVLNTYGSFQKKSDRRKAQETGNEDDLSSVSGSLSDSEDDARHSPAAKAGPGGGHQRPSSAYGRGGHSNRDSNRNRNNSYGGGGGGLSGSPLTKLPNSKERRRQNRTSGQQRKHARKTL
ncbi:hypothetical protein DV735_g1860, partial [Chaetothyriales sp. CBS 134920]